MENTNTYGPGINPEVKTEQTTDFREDLMFKVFSALTEAGDVAFPIDGGKTLKIGNITVDLTEQELTWLLGTIVKSTLDRIHSGTDDATELVFKKSDKAYPVPGNN